MKTTPSLKALPAEQLRSCRPNLSGIPSQPAAPVSLAKTAATEAQLQTLLDEYGITLERARYVTPDWMSSGRDFLGDRHLTVGSGVDTAKVIEFVQVLIERDDMQPKAQNPNHSSNRPRVRLAPILVGSRDRFQTVYAECPWWCTESHAEPIGSLDDLVHASGGSLAQLETMDDNLYDLSAQIAADPASSDERLRAAHVQLGGLIDDAALTPDQADDVADELITLASQMRQQAAIARRFNTGGAQ